MGPGGLERVELEVAGLRRGYWLARRPQPGGALLIMLEQVTANQDFPPVGVSDDRPPPPR